MNSAKIFFIPTLLIFLTSLGLYNIPTLSYLIAWLGSFYIFYLTWLSPLRLVQTDLSSTKQIMRPIFLLQLIFAGFMCCTSIFYFLNHLGYEYFTKINPANFISSNQTYLIAKCQRLCLLAHIALVGGILVRQQRLARQTTYQFKAQQQTLPQKWLHLSIAFYVIALLFQFTPGLKQFHVYFNNLAIFSAALLLLKGLRNKNMLWLVYGLVLFGLNFINGSLSGYKEHILTSVIILFALLFPYYKRLILFLSLPTIYLLLYILPTYASVIRAQAWSGEKTAEEARANAFQTLMQDENEDEIVETNWTFLTDRFSEINMFTEFAAYVPEKRDFYHFEILKNSIEALIPRVLLPNKEITELVAMERVYEAGVIDRAAKVSAKTRPVVDAYLSFGYIGVFICLFLLGYVIQFFNQTAERWFGGYEFGCIVMFNGCFQALWRGNNFEFMLNNMVYGFLTMWLVFIALKKLQIIVPKPHYR